MKLEDILGTSKVIIGALHFSPMIGYKGFTSYETVLKTALLDLEAFENGGVDAVIIENNYDLPHKIKVSSDTEAMMTRLGSELAKHASKPLGVSVLWNDYRAALRIAKAISGKFIRVPVFIDDVRTDFGDIYGDARDAIEYRKKINAEDVALLIDIQVKHAEMLDKNKPITESAKQAIAAGSDAIILTGKWTGDAPDLNELKEVRAAVGDFPILLGSGINQENVRELFEYADGAIISTSLKEGSAVAGERNIKPYTVRVSTEKVGALISAIRRVRWK